MGDHIETKKIVVTVQENGIIRNSKGRIIARFVEDIEFDGEHVVEEKIYNREEVEAIVREAYKIGDPETTDYVDTYQNGFENWLKKNL